jgi:hypothetical protein
MSEGMCAAALSSCCSFAQMAASKQQLLLISDVSCSAVQTAQQWHVTLPQSYNFPATLVSRCTYVKI